MTRTGPQSPATSRAGRFVRLSGWPFRHRWAALGVWVLVLAAVAVAAGAAGAHYRNDFTLPGTARRLPRIALERDTTPTGRHATTAGALTGSPEGTRQP